MTLNPDDERRLRRNWSLLKQELRVDELVHRFVEDSIFPPVLRSEILNVIPNTASMKAEKFLNAVIASGNRGYQAMCQYIRDNPDNRNTEIMEVLEISVRNHVNGNNSDNGQNINQNSRPSTAVSSTSSGTVNSETGERNRRIKFTYDDHGAQQGQHTTAAAPVATVTTLVSMAPTGQNIQHTGAQLMQWQSITAVNLNGATNDQQALFQERSWNCQSEMSIELWNSGHMQGNSSTTPQISDSPNNTDESDTPVDMQVLEQELVRMAPTIADLFKKIAKQTSSIPTSEEEIQKVKDENERLRKTNKSLIEKLNAFQQKIIQLQLDNKRLKEGGGELGRIKKEELKHTAEELQELERRLDDHKKALNEKEQELHTQLLKLKYVEEENEIQKEKIDKLEELQDEGIVERNIQQEQISTLAEEKERQKDQIGSLEEQQKVGEERLYRLEERLKMLEQGSRQNGRGRRVVSPPRNNYWTNGVMNRSHHANVKFQSDIKCFPSRDEHNTSSSGKKGLPFI